MDVGVDGAVDVDDDNGVIESTELIEGLAGKMIRFVSEDLESLLTIARFVKGKMFVRPPKFVCLTVDFDLALVLSPLIPNGLLFGGDCFMIVGFFLSHFLIRSIVSLGVVYF